ncbi:hypothetical protein [Pleionea sediminis]|uniref:hypothetical protein n=1 Tax=Pleionea sediminis TaxID=2569479 RepID=UPI0011864DBF|nr:hypothetical protein [Pleionea sediminis]
MKSTEAVLKLWEQFTLRGNQFCHDNNYVAAQLAFEKSVDGLTECLNCPPKRNLATLIRCFVLGCQNAAYCAERNGQRQVAEYFHRLCLKKLTLLRRSKKYHRLADYIDIEKQSVMERFQLLTDNIFLLENTLPWEQDRSSQKTKNDPFFGRISFLFF